MFKDTKAKDHAVGGGDAGGKRVLRQDFTVEVPAVLLDYLKISYSRAGAGLGENVTVI